MNMFRMKLYPILALLLAGHMALGQGNKNQTTQQVQQVLDDTGDFKVANMSRTFDNRPINTRGTPFYVSDWRAGEAILANTMTPYKGEFKLDVMNDRLMVKRPGGDSIWVSTDRLTAITLNPAATNEPAVHFRRFELVKSDEQFLQMALLRVLNEGAYGALVQLPIRRFYKAAPNDPYSLHATTNEIRDESVYYVIRPDQMAVKVKLNRRSLTDAMGDVGKQLELHAKANNLSLKTEKEVINALTALPGSVR
jgi:hypothetical protein